MFVCQICLIQVNLLQSLKEELEKKDRQSDLYEQLKATEEKMKKAETEADQFYEKCCKEEAKVSDLQNDIEQKIKEIHQLKQELENMESTGHSMKENGEPSALKKKFTQIYSKYHAGLTLEGDSGEEVALWLLTSLCTSAKREVEVAL